MICRLFQISPRVHWEDGCLLLCLKASPRISSPSLFGVFLFSYRSSRPSAVHIYYRLPPFFSPFFLPLLLLPPPLCHMVPLSNNQCNLSRLDAAASVFNERGECWEILRHKTENKPPNCRTKKSVKRPQAARVTFIWKKKCWYMMLGKWVLNSDKAKLMREIFLFVCVNRKWFARLAVFLFKTSWTVLGLECNMWDTHCKWVCRWNGCFCDL